jgi:hypothetical protein
MNYQSEPISKQTFNSIINEIEEYFRIVSEYVSKRKDELNEYDSVEGNLYHRGYIDWVYLSDEIKVKAEDIVDRLLVFCGSLAKKVSVSALTGPEDLIDVKISTKAIRASIYLRRYYYTGPSAIHDEGTVLGYQPAEQYEDNRTDLTEAITTFNVNSLKLSGILKLVEADNSQIVTYNNILNGQSTKYRPDTAFIMMWMDKKRPELIDVADTVRTVFKSFGIRAIRADDIEHEGLITERILNEIKTSEFLFADLTGIRPNVYYEVGYAHALGKRVILLRKSGTGLEFDLAGYNCPEYDNLKDLREKLSRRLIILTNRNPSDDELS